MKVLDLFFVPGHFVEVNKPRCWLFALVSLGYYYAFVSVSSSLAYIQLPRLMEGENGVDVVALG